MSDEVLAQTDSKRAQDERDAPDGADAAEIRFGLTPLGEAAVVERHRNRFCGFGPCAIATLPAAR